MKASVAAVAARYDQRATRLYASAVLFGKAPTNALRRARRAIGQQAAAPGWEACLSHLGAVEEALRTLQDASRPGRRS